MLKWNVTLKAAVTRCHSDNLIHNPHCVFFSRIYCSRTLSIDKEETFWSISYTLRHRSNKILKSWLYVILMAEFAMTLKLKYVCVAHCDECVFSYRDAVRDAVYWIKCVDGSGGSSINEPFYHWSRALWLTAPAKKRRRGESMCVMNSFCRHLVNENTQRVIRRGGLHS